MSSDGGSPLSGLKDAASGLFSGNTVEGKSMKTGAKTVATFKDPAQPPPPNLQTSTTKALDDQLNHELQMRASQSMYPSSTGLLDNQGTNVASRVLLGV